ncbi:DUF2752 domain-containing protein [Nocardioides sp. GY 10113]|uniref:DUF2752 domain-containing protein n=1 Tax=Nocardioides sp. GY 10113 TaxID=2569761 RepID=UPI0010A91EB1|nr:DUF2752 domain-containing protein [Nocardioides sp. GY 10113]TIC88988.1 DUF2752 domain-containing protein [Nocardioides sp. GY 10113]
MTPRTPPSSLSSAEVLAGGGVLALAVACLLSPRTIEDGPVLCPFRQLTGLPCPGCGLTRSWVYLVHGWWRESLAAHPFGPVAAGIVVLVAVLLALSRVRRSTPPSLDRWARHPLAWGFAAAWLGFAVVRMAVEA